MNRLFLRCLIVANLLATGTVFGADTPAKTGIIKGTITIVGKPTADAVVSIEAVGAPQPKPPAAGAKAKKATMDQREMKFIPRVLPILVGTTVDFPNKDKNWHDVFSTSAAKKFDLGLYAPGKTRSVTFDKPGIVRILCNVHPNMEAFIVVKESPYFSAVDGRGNYRIDGIPIGKYRVQVWHPEADVTDAPAELVREGEVLDINVDLKKK
jgi:plastocyanin